jgi:hypothetical protein
MTVRRALIVAGAVALAGTLVVLVKPPPPRTGEASVHGPRLVRTPAESVESLAITIGEHHVAARRLGGRWTVAGKEASPPLEDALADLLRTLTTLRAVDRFRPRDGASFGFDPPHATIELGSRRGTTRIVLGELNAGRSAVYARREDTAHVWVVGLYLVSALERVIYFASLESPSTSAS